MDIDISNSITIGPLELNLYGLLLGIGFAIIYINVDKRYSKQLKLVDYIIVLISTLVGARIFFLVNNLETVVEEPKFIFDLQAGGLALFGALFGLLTSTYSISKLRKIPFLQLSDTIFTYVPIAQAIGRFGNYFNQELYGKPTDLPWGIEIDPGNRLTGYEEYTSFHPTFLYETILNILNFLILSKIIPEDKRGYRTAFYFINYSLIRLLMNRLRIDKEFFGLIENSDLYALIGLISGLILLFYLNRKQNRDISQLTS